MNISFSYYTSQGRREKNEDSVMISESDGGLLAMIADGAGGIQGGDIASRLTVKTFQNNVDIRTVSENELNRAAQTANTAVRECGPPAMCTTLAALCIGRYKAYACHIGDSRIYQIRGGKIIYQSRDHSLSQMAVIMGEITSDEIRAHRSRNCLVRAIGAEETVIPETVPLDFRQGDAFLLCSDGFWQVIFENDIIRYLSSLDDAGKWLSEMRDYVECNMGPDGDNSSAVAIIIR